MNIWLFLQEGSREIILGKTDKDTMIKEYGDSEE